MSATVIQRAEQFAKTADWQEAVDIVRGLLALVSAHDCANVRAANSTLRYHLDRACEARDKYLRLAERRGAALAEIANHNTTNCGHESDGDCFYFAKSVARPALACEPSTDPASPKP